MLTLKYEYRYNLAKEVKWQQVCEKKDFHMFCGINKCDYKCFDLSLILSSLFN